jgi:hypothetical protein
LFCSARKQQERGENRGEQKRSQTIQLLHHGCTETPGPEKWPCDYIADTPLGELNERCWTNYSVPASQDIAQFLYELVGIAAVEIVDDPQKTAKQASREGLGVG